MIISINFDYHDFFFFLIRAILDNPENHGSKFRRSIIQQGGIKGGSFLFLTLFCPLRQHKIHFAAFLVGTGNGHTDTVA